MFKAELKIICVEFGIFQFILKIILSPKRVFFTEIPPRPRIAPIFFSVLFDMIVRVVLKTLQTEVFYRHKMDSSTNFAFMEETIDKTVNMKVGDGCEIRTVCRTKYTQTRWRHDRETGEQHSRKHLVVKKDISVNHIKYCNCQYWAYCWWTTGKDGAYIVSSSGPVYMCRRYTWMAVMPSRGHFVYAPSQGETTLQCNVVSHWLGAFTLSLHLPKMRAGFYSCLILHFMMTLCQ